MGYAALGDRKRRSDGNVTRRPSAAHADTSCSPRAVVSQRVSRSHARASARRWGTSLLRQDSGRRSVHLSNLRLKFHRRPGWPRCRPQSRISRAERGVRDGAGTPTRVRSESRCLARAFFPSAFPDSQRRALESALVTIKSASAFHHRTVYWIFEVWVAGGGYAEGFKFGTVSGVHSKRGLGVEDDPLSQQRSPALVNRNHKFVEGRWRARHRTTRLRVRCRGACDLAAEHTRSRPGVGGEEALINSRDSPALALHLPRIPTPMAFCCQH